LKTPYFASEVAPFQVRLALTVPETHPIGLTSFLPFSFTIIVGCALLISHRTTNHLFAVYAQIVCIIFVTTFIQWSIGGIFASGFVMIWASLGPMVSLMFLSLRKSLVWLGVFLLNVLITVLFNGFFAGHGLVVSQGASEFFFAMNTLVASTVVFVFAAYFVTSAVNERQRANGLLRNILPEPIAARLKNSSATIADGFAEVTVLFADIVDFTTMCSGADPVAVVALLNEVFSEFDELASKHGLEKIKTIGDAYMVVAGLPEPRTDHVEAVIAFAREMLVVADRFTGFHGKPIQLRVGINSGPVVAGVIGRQKFIYDLWVDAVNVASRMESNGLTNQILVTAMVKNRVDDRYEFVARDPIDIKGKGMMVTYVLVRERSPH